VRIYLSAGCAEHVRDTSYFITSANRLVAAIVRTVLRGEWQRYTRMATGLMAGVKIK
jgi:hypothetical protein